MLLFKFKEFEFFRKGGGSRLPILRLPSRFAHVKCSIFSCIYHARIYREVLTPPGKFKFIIFTELNCYKKSSNPPPTYTIIPWTPPPLEIISGSAHVNFIKFALNWSIIRFPLHLLFYENKQLKSLYSPCIRSMTF